MTNGRRVGEGRQIIDPGIPGADNRWFTSQGQARRAALSMATRLGGGHSIVHDPRPLRGLPHYHVVTPSGQRVSGHYFYGRRPPRRVLRGRPWREFESELEAAERMALSRQTQNAIQDAEDILGAADLAGFDVELAHRHEIQCIRNAAGSRTEMLRAGRELRRARQELAEAQRAAYRAGMAGFGNRREARSRLDAAQAQVRQVGRRYQDHRRKLLDLRQARQASQAAQARQMRLLNQAAAATSSARRDLRRS